MAGTGRLRMAIGGLLAVAALVAIVAPSGSSGDDTGQLLIAVAALVLTHVPAIMARLRGRDGGPGAFGAAEE
jgi:hypothetical protein